MRPVFVAPAQDPLTPAVIRNLYDVGFATDGSNRLGMEEDTIYSFEIFLEHCAC